MDWAFEAQLIHWRGPAPFVFAPLSPDLSAEVKEAARGLMYWGQVPVTARVGGTEFTTAMFPKGDRFLLPVRAAIQRAEGVDVGDVVRVEMSLRR